MLLLRWGGGREEGWNYSQAPEFITTPMSNNHPSVSAERNNPFNFIIIDCFWWPCRKVKMGVFYFFSPPQLENKKELKEQAARKRLTHAGRRSRWVSDNWLADWWWRHTTALVSYAEHTCTKRAHAHTHQSHAHVPAACSVELENTFLLAFCKVTNTRTPTQPRFSKRLSLSTACTIMYK